eukprot:scpid82926/ scgid5437/ ATP-dependent (S)-NAD(P)H-hydrate dehydratase; ATP-dependent NAD(P)HX dehydratase; Carbohydrate kinase domain-containing protein
MAVRGAALQHQLRELVLSIIPPLSVTNHKGQMGRVAVVGGSKEYTGAPYYAAISALKLGADLSFVFCTENAAVPIKTYSPELIVIPMLDSDSAMDVMKSHWLPRLHVLVVGPGLGLDQQVRDVSYNIVKEAIDRSLPLVVDADGLGLLIDRPDMLDCCSTAILTPNIAEFKRLCKSRLDKDVSEYSDLSAAVLALAKTLANVTVVLKGPVDIISDGEKVLTCDVPGTLRRCGGQGDVLSGSMATWLHWSHLSVTGASTGPPTGSTEAAISHTKAATAILGSATTGSRPTVASSGQMSSGQYHMGRTLLQHYGPVVSAAYAACSFTRMCAHLAFDTHGRTMTTPNIIESFANAMATL